METITDAVSIHSIKKAEYARRLATGGLGHVSLLDHFKTVRVRVFDGVFRQRLGN
jgi:phosphatidylinositol 4-kinase